MSRARIFMTPVHASRQFNLRLVKSILIKWNSAGEAAWNSGVQEFYRKCLSNFPRESNPKCKVDFEQLEIVKGPEVYIEFDDGRKLEWKNASFLKPEHFMGKVIEKKEKIKYFYRQVGAEFEDSDDEDYMGVLTKTTSDGIEVEDEESYAKEEPLSVVYVPKPRYPYQKQMVNSILPRNQLPMNQTSYILDEIISDPKPLPKYISCNSLNIDSSADSSSKMFKKKESPTIHSRWHYEASSHTTPEKNIFGNLKTLPKMSLPITKQLKTRNGNGSPDLAQKKNYSVDKARTRLPKRCGDEKCQYGQHYLTAQEAAVKNKDFNTRKGKNTYCPCGATIQYFIDGTWMRSGQCNKKGNVEKTTRQKW
eukprot:gene9503-1709_t